MGVFMREQLRGLSDTVADVCAAGSRDELSGVILGRVQSLVPHEKNILTWTAEKADGKPETYSRTMSRQLVASYEERFAKHDYTAWYLNMPDVSVYRDSDLVSPERMRDSLIFKEWVQPMGMFHVCGAVFRFAGRRIGDIVLFRPEEAGDYTDDELFLLELLVEQVERRFGSLEAMSANIVMDAWALLTDREREVARLATADQDVRGIANQLGISYNTVRKHMASIYEKLGVNSRIRLVRMLMQIE